MRIFQDNFFSSVGSQFHSKTGCLVYNGFIMCCEDEVNTLSVHGEIELLVTIHRIKLVS